MHRREQQQSGADQGKSGDEVHEVYRVLQVTSKHQCAFVSNSNGNSDCRTRWRFVYDSNNEDFQHFFHFCYTNDDINECKCGLQSGDNHFHVTCNIKANNITGNEQPTHLTYNIHFRSPIYFYPPFLFFLVVIIINPHIPHHHPRHHHTNPDIITHLPHGQNSDITSTNNNTKTAPWVWVIVGITITVVFLLSSGSFFFFYKKGRSKRGLTRHEGMKGMVELKETTVGSHGFVDGWSDAASLRTGTTRAGIMRRVMDEAGGPGSNVMELEGSGSGSGSGSGGGRGVGGIGTTKGNGNGNVPPVEMPSCGNGFAELPTEFNRRGPGEEVVVVK
ncbi:hypothetical protein NEUTE2DRAFT_130912 [Neurospora tetrasperma FGSC 2509]|nr:hypothetical protein NEUTE2DRAFT_130912 [Neurospora tetrasperma FGSC 2509]